MKITEMEHEQVMKLFRGYAKKISLLAKRGDQLSQKVKATYEHLYDHLQEAKAHYEFRKMFEEWMKVNLDITARHDLALKYGYLVEGEDPSGEQRTVSVQ